MEKYKLINKQTGEEHLCEKVVIDGFNYYVSEEKEQVLLGRLYYEHDNHIPIYSFTEDTLPSQYYLPQVIATNNPNIDIPKVVDKVLNLGFKTIENNQLLSTKTEKLIAITGFYEGYMQSQETHPNSDEDMIEFAEWIDNNSYFKSGAKDDKWFFNDFEDMDKDATLIASNTKELLQLWKEQRPKIVYYE